ncbi:MAG: AraC family transcriptional regulator [Spirochaetaceae bacterium]|jgi:AraC family transcriptional regulator of arabinose operon|nr:AraC family transcriptional regulator [Spirochaetaceae bacterium]
MVLVIMKYPGIDQINEEHIFRSVGNSETGEQLGFGFMHKKNRKIDEENSIFRFYSMVYVIRGTGMYIDDSGNKYPLSPGSIFQRFPGISHSTYIDPRSNWSECYMDFGINIFALLSSLNIINKEKPVHKIHPDITIEIEIFHNLMRLKNSGEHQLPELIIKSMELLRSILSRSINLEKNFLPLNIIEKSCSDFTSAYRERIDIKEYCQRQGWGYESFRKFFKNEIGISPGKYLVRRRIDMACQILMGSDKLISEISENLGYKNQYEFSAQFKKLIGISPNNYRLRK